MHEKFVPELLAVLNQIEKIEHKVSHIELDRRKFESCEDYDNAYYTEVSKIKQQMGTELLISYCEKYVKPHITASSLELDVYGVIHAHLSEQF